MQLNRHWIEELVITPDDIESLTGLLLEREIPLSIDDLARALITHHLERQVDEFRARYRDVRVYDPADAYQLGQRLLFPVFGNALGSVVAVQPGNNPDIPDFDVITVTFDSLNGTAGATKKFAARSPIPHKLNQTNGNSLPLPGIETTSADELLKQYRDPIVRQLSEALAQDGELVSVAGKWFPRSLMPEVDLSVLHLAEAVLEVADGIPLATLDILEQIGGLGVDAPIELQEFCLNDALNHDDRFDEVGPLNTVLWALKRLLPPEVQTTPFILQYQPIEHDPTLLLPEMAALEAEIDDEWSPFEPPRETLHEANLTLNYPHRRAGTLPLNSKLQGIFPTARRTPRVYVKLVDGLDGEEFVGWVVRAGKYVYGLKAFYKKHSLPVGVRLTASRSADGSKIIIRFNPNKPHNDWVNLLVPNNGHITFEAKKRAIGAEYDAEMLIGADDLAGIDALHTSNTKGQKKALSVIVRDIGVELSRLTPQGNFSGKTIYNAVNVVRRCPPGVVFATLLNHPDFTHVANNVWKYIGS